jgi:threonine dehydrogenase-like Zn-dependent dehydrogenase
MKGVVFVGDRQIDIREVPKPTPGPGEVVLAMKASGLCGSDLRPYRLPRAQRGNPSALTVGGHEPCGVVAEVGPEVTTVKVGDRIILGPTPISQPSLLCRYASAASVMKNSA